MDETTVTGPLATVEGKRELLRRTARFPSAAIAGAEPIQIIILAELMDQNKRMAITDEKVSAIKPQVESILEQAKKTNGRVTTLETGHEILFTDLEDRKTVLLQSRAVQNYRRSIYSKVLFWPKAVWSVLKWIGFGVILAAATYIHDHWMIPKP